MPYLSFYIFNLFNFSPKKKNGVIFPELEILALNP